MESYFCANYKQIFFSEQQILVTFHPVVMITPVPARNGSLIAPVPQRQQTGTEGPFTLAIQLLMI